VAAAGSRLGQAGRAFLSGQLVMADWAFASRKRLRSWL
jgi:hypothetical protein